MFPPSSYHPIICDTAILHDLESVALSLTALQGWTPTNDIESVVVQIRAQMVVGKARIDFGSIQVTQVRANSVKVSYVAIPFDGRCFCMYQNSRL